MILPLILLQPPAGLDLGDNCPSIFNIQVEAGESFLDADFCYTNSDSEPPVIMLNGYNPQELLLDEPYTELGATVTDNSGETINPTIDSSLVDITTPGKVILLVMMLWILQAMLQQQYLEQ